MPATDDVIHSQDDSERLGTLWRSQGEAFLEEHAAALIADVDRLRQAFVAGLAVAAPPAPLIDLRDDGVAGMACSRHGNVSATARCIRCRSTFCAECIVQPEATHGEPLCTECALVAGGVHHKRARPLVAPGRPGRRA
jgi:hypothetical protein